MKRKGKRTCVQLKWVVDYCLSNQLIWYKKLNDGNQINDGKKVKEKWQKWIFDDKIEQITISGMKILFFIIIYLWLKHFLQDPIMIIHIDCEQQSSGKKWTNKNLFHW